MKKNKHTKRAYVNQVPVRHGEVTVVTSTNAVATMKHSSRLAVATQKAGVPVLLVNCGMSDKRFREYFYETHSPQIKKQELVLHSSVRGNLIGEREAIDQIVEETGTGVLIIAGWEWTSDSYRRKQRLLSYLRALAEERDVAIVIYSHIANAPIAGEIDHGGLGKLSLLAMFVVEIEASKVLEDAAPKPPPLVSQSLEEEEAAERSAQVLINNINGLEGEPHPNPLLIQGEGMEHCPNPLLIKGEGNSRSDIPVRRELLR
jgi:hypothetical protein